jgi:hypothetical protein
MARGDIMKVYDYAARGRPIVSTHGVVDAGQRGLPGFSEGDTPAAYAQALSEAFETPNAILIELRLWAEQNSWNARWPEWRAVLFGENEPDRFGRRSP